MMNVEQTIDTIQDLIATHSQEASAHLQRIGAIALEGKNIGEHSRYYYESKARIFVLKDLLEKISKTSEDTGKSKYNLLCNDVIRDAQGNEIGRARSIE